MGPSVACSISEQADGTDQVLLTRNCGLTLKDEAIFVLNENTKESIDKSVLGLGILCVYVSRMSVQLWIL